MCLSEDDNIEAELRGLSGLKSLGSETALLCIYVLCVILGASIAGR